MKGFLLVDDERGMFPLYSKLVKDNFEAVVFTAVNSADAEDILLKINPAIDVIISDINRPGKNGLDFATDVHKQFPAIKIFIVSGNMADGRRERAQELIKSGVITGLLDKPFDLKDFKQMLADGL